MGLYGPICYVSIYQLCEKTPITKGTDMPLMLNSVHIAGNLTRDPEVKIVGENRTVASFGLAINRRYRGSDGQQKEETCFLEIECWGRQAELVGQFLTKGRNCLIEGSLQYQQWTDKNNNKRSQVRVLAQRVHFIGGAQQASPRVQESTQTAEQELAPAGVNYEDEPPF